jgi:hypothetical protein
MSNQKPDPFYDGLCKFQFADGRHCKMPAHPDHKGFCLNHGTAHRRSLHREDDLTRELASPAGDFITQMDINHVLGKLFDAVAANRCSPRRAATLAYIGNLLLQSQNGARHEAANWSWEGKILKKISDLKFPQPPAKPSNPSVSANPDSEPVFTFPPRSSSKSPKP